MSAYLLDTHVIVWLATDPDQVPARVRAALVAATDLRVSSASAYELAQKVRLGRMPAAAPLLARWQELTEAMMATELALSSAHMRLAGGLDWEHRDPFDRMLVAQSQQDGLVLVTKNAAIRSYGGAPCIPWR